VRVKSANAQISGADADVALAMQWGKGNWKKIKDEAGELLKNRSQVDLKDKWRNLELQGVVQAPVKAKPASGDEPLASRQLQFAHVLLALLEGASRRCL